MVRIRNVAMFQRRQQQPHGLIATRRVGSLTSLVALMVVLLVLSREPIFSVDNDNANGDGSLLRRRDEVDNMEGTMAATATAVASNNANAMVIQEIRRDSDDAESATETMENNNNDASAVATAEHAPLQQQEPPEPPPVQQEQEAPYVPRFVPNATLLHQIHDGTYLPRHPERSHEADLRGAACDATGDNFLEYMKLRYQRWNLSRVDSEGVYQATPYLTRHKIWQLALDDKFGSYLFAKAMGVRVPRIHVCGPFTDTLLALEKEQQQEPQASSSPDGTSSSSTKKTLPDDASSKGFVVKTVQGHSSVGVWVFEQGLPGKERIRGEEWTHERLSGVFGHSSRTMMFLEEMVASEIPGEMIFDYKVFAYNGEIAVVSVMAHRGTEQECTLQVDEHYQQIDAVCVDQLKPPSWSQPCRGAFKCAFCTASQTPKGWPQLIAQAKRLSRRIGVMMRIDFFLDTTTSEPVLGEITPCSGAGHFHCLAKVLHKPPASRPAIPSSRPPDIDACWVGELWRLHSPASKLHPVEQLREDHVAMEGGPITPVPRYLEGWYDLDIHEKCRRVMHADEFLKEHPDAYASLAEAETAQQHVAEKA